MAMLLIPLLPCLQGTERPVSGYSTLVIEYIGEMDRPVFPIILSSSAKEGEWCRQHLVRQSDRTFTHVYVVPASNMKNVTAIRPLTNGLERSVPPPDQPKAPTVKFVAGAGHQYTGTTLDAQTAMTVLMAIDRHVAYDSALDNELSEIEGHLAAFVSRQRH
jgi:hypothetical protein